MSKITIQNCAKSRTVTLYDIPVGTYFYGIIAKEVCGDKYTGLFARSQYKVIRLNDLAHSWEPLRDIYVTDYQPVNVTITTEPVTNG